MSTHNVCLQRNKNIKIYMLLSSKAVFLPNRHFIFLLKHNTRIPCEYSLEASIVPGTVFQPKNDSFMAK